MENEFMKRGYLLPKGCKDLTDVLKLKRRCVAHPSRPTHRRDLPPTGGEIQVEPQMTVSALAAALGQKPFRIIADLMEIGVFASVEQQLDFETVSRVARKYGFAAKKAV